LLPALVLSTGTAALGVIRSLGRRGVPVIGLYQDESEVGRSSRHLQEALQAPHPDREEPAFIDFLLGLAARFEGAVVMPCADGSLGAVARHKADLSRHFRVACPEPDTARTVLEKSLTYQAAEKVGVAAPRTLVLESDAQAEREGQRVLYPCLVKPVTGHGYSRRFHKKMVLATNAAELMAAWREADAAGYAMMLQEFVPGPDGNGVNYNAYFWEGKPLVEFTAAKIRGAPPQIGSPRVVRSQHVPAVIEPGRRLLESLGYSGFACTEFKWDARDERFKLMEINGRHNMSSKLAARCGIDFPWLEYRHRASGELPEGGPYQEGVYWIDLARDVAHSLKHRRSEGYSLREYLAPYRSPHVFAALDWDDLRPWLAGFRAVGSRLRGRLQRRPLPQKAH
jgi:predicted ATP-grasp superfamily ATP-dependent carboligase